MSLLIFSDVCFDSQQKRYTNKVCLTNCNITVLPSRAKQILQLSIVNRMIDMNLPIYKDNKGTFKNLVFQIVSLQYDLSEIRIWIDSIYWKSISIDAPLHGYQGFVLFDGTIMLYKSKGNELPPSHTSYDSYGGSETTCPKDLHKYKSKGNRIETGPNKYRHHVYGINILTGAYKSMYRLSFVPDMNNVTSHTGYLKTCNIQARFAKTHKAYYDKLRQEQWIVIYQTDHILAMLNPVTSYIVVNDFVLNKVCSFPRARMELSFQSDPRFSLTCPRSSESVSPPEPASVPASINLIDEYVDLLEKPIHQLVLSKSLC